MMTFRTVNGFADARWLLPSSLASSPSSSSPSSSPSSSIITITIFIASSLLPPLVWPCGAHLVGRASLERKESWAGGQKASKGCFKQVEVPLPPRGTTGPLWAVFGLPAGSRDSGNELTKVTGQVLQRQSLSCRGVFYSPVPAWERVGSREQGGPLGLLGLPASLLVQWTQLSMRASAVPALLRSTVYFF